MKNSIFLFALLALFFGSCANENEISIINQNFEDEVQLSQNLSFTFNKNLVNEADLNQWESTEYITFIPEIQGKYKWVAKNEIVFSPIQSLAPSTEYTAKISEKVLSKIQEKKWRLSNKKLDFHSPFLKIESTQSYWAKGQNDTKPIAKINVHFNYPLQSEEVAIYLKIKSKTENISFEIGNNKVSNKVTLSLKSENLKAESNLSILLEKGLNVPNSSYSTLEKVETSLTLPAQETLEITNIEQGFEKNTGYIRIFTNQQLKGNDLEKLYTIATQNNNHEAETPATIITYDTLGNAIEIPNPDKKIALKTQKLFTKAELFENGFVIKGDFNETDNYILTVKKELSGIMAKTMEDNYVNDIYFGQMPASLSFSNKKAIYLSSKGNKNIAVDITNIPKVNVKISKIYENNILQFMKTSRYKDYNYDSEDGGDSKKYTYYDDAEGNLSDIVVNKTIETENLTKIKGVSVLNLSLPSQNTGKGIYLVTLNSNDSYYLNATKLVSISDIGLITKQSAEEITVFANSIKTTEPIANVEITIISSNNQNIKSLKTNGKGVVTFKNLNATSFKPAMITGHTIDDFNYLYFDGAEVETSRYEVEGARNNITGFEAFIYSDRNIYRPGETVFFNTIIRKQNWETVGEIPVKVRFLMPNGREYKSFRLKTNAQGAVDEKIVLDKSAVTGTYRLEVLNANDVLLNSQPISIEEFMPDRIKVNVNTNKEYYKPGDSAIINAEATNLFGPPASDRNYEMQVNLNRKRFQPIGFENYTFDIEDNTKFEQIVREGKTDAKGIAKESFELSKNYADMGILEAKAFITVFDETGRPVNRLKTFEVVTQAVFYGIAMPNYYLNTNVPSQISLVSINKDGKGENDKAQLTIIRHDYQNIIEKNSDNSVKYSSKRQDKIVYNREVNLKTGKATISYAAPISGEYEIRLQRPGSRTYTQQSFYAYGFGNTENTSFEVNNEGQVLMEFDKEKYKIGEKAKILFKTPFEGKLIVTIEQNKVLQYYELRTDKNAAELSFKLGAEHLPNVYVSATLIRPLDDSNMPLTVAHGYASVMVEDADNAMAVEVIAVEKSRSKTHQKIRIKTKANTQVTIAVVDEGILQVKNFKTPDPHGYFYQKKALEVNSFDLYPFLFPELSISSRSSTGGDGYNLEKRINPLSNGRVNLVAFWSGIKQTGLSGETEFEFDVPQFSGDLRIMVVAYKNNAFGSANKSMRVNDPLVISTALPRFVSPGDEIFVPINITNTTKQNANTVTNITLSSNLELVGNKSQNITIPAEKEGRAGFMVRAKNAIGQGEVLVKVNGFKENFTEKTAITIRPSAGFVKNSVSGNIIGGESKQITMPKNNFIAGTFNASLLISRSPLFSFTNNFQDLLNYPHGCLEQTISTAFPQLYFSDFVKQIKIGNKPYTKGGENDLNPYANVQAAINKIATLQLANGGLSMWQAGDSENWWSTAYALHFLLEAQKADFDVNNSFVASIIEYLTAKTNSQTTETGYFKNTDGSYTNRSIAKREAIYSLYTLALAGKPNRPIMNYYKANNNLLTQDEKYMLACSFQLTGDGQSYKAILPKTFGNEVAKTETGGSFSSPIRNVALSINCLLETDPNNLQIPAMARQLSSAIKGQTYLNTQEQAFSFLVFGKLSKQANNATITATILQNKKPFGTYSGTDLLLNKNVGNSLVINTKGNGYLYYFGQSEGVSSHGKVTEIDNGLVVRKTFFNRNGEVVSPSNFLQNQLIIVKITLASVNGLGIENIVITDMLPAGLEIENPRLTAERDLSWIKGQSQAEHFDIRDDRINYFTNINKTPKSFYYMARAVSKGKFNMGPVSADAMYFGEYRSYSGSGICEIK